MNVNFGFKTSVPHINQTVITFNNAISHVCAVLKADLCMITDSIDRAVVQLIFHVATVVHGGNGRHGGRIVRLCVSLQYVSCSPCHRWWQSSVCDWF